MLEGSRNREVHRFNGVPFTSCRVGQNASREVSQGTEDGKPCGKIEATETLIKGLVQNAPTNEMRTTMFVGTVLGTIIQTMNHEIGIETTNLIGQYLQAINDLSDHEREMLSDFLSEALI